MEVSVLSLSNPVSPLGPLETVGRPVPSILRFDDVEFSIKSKGHDRVSRVGSSAIHDNLVQSIQTHDSDVITRLDQRGVNVNLLYGSHLHGVLDSIFKELNVSFLHILGYVGTQDLRSFIGVRS